MAIYHCSVKIIGRNSGRSAVAAAAYRAGEDIVNEYDGVEHDFRRKHWIEHTEIILPENAPPEYSDRSTLWNAVEMSEKSKDAQLCREIEVALPVEMTMERQIRIVEQLVQEKLTSQGMIADIAIHNPPVKNDRNQPIDTEGNVTHDTEKMQFINPHAHILLTVRPMDANGKWQKKSEIEYLCKRGDKEKGLTAAEFKDAKENGWEKQYKYIYGKKKIWLTAQEGKERGLERVNRSPKTTRFGRLNQIVEYWNSKDRVFEWRQYWEKVVNDEFSRMDSNIRIDNRSFKDQGREDEIPTIHMGPAATNMERRAEREFREGTPEALVIHSDIGNINKQIKEHNHLLKELKTQIDAAIKKVRMFASEIAHKLEGIRAKIIMGRYQEETFSIRLKILLSRIRFEGDRIEKYRVAVDKVKKANRQDVEEIRRLKNDRAVSPSSAAQKASQKKLQELQAQIEIREEYLINVERMCGFTSAEGYGHAKDKYKKDCADKVRLQGVIEALKNDIDQLKEQYDAELELIPVGYEPEIENDRLKSRIEMQKIVRSGLQKKYGKDFDEDRYAQACRSADKLLGIKTEGMEGRRPARNPEKSVGKTRHMR